MKKRYRGGGGEYCKKIKRSTPGQGNERRRQRECTRRCTQINCRMMKTGKFLPYRCQESVYALCQLKHD